MNALFEVKDLHVTYRRPGEKPLEAVKGVSFELAAGETLGIVGESGSGKSTIAKALMLLQPTSGGEIRFGGKNVATFSAAERRAYRRDVQMVFQDAVGSLNPRMTIRQALAEALAFAPGAPRQTPASLLDIVGLSAAVLDQYPRELSGGQCQRASFARALAVEPRVLVADEPVSALDVSVQARILNLLRDLRRNLNLAVILIAHDLAVVRNVCDRVCVMHRGLFADVGAADAVFAQPKSDYTKTLLAAVPDVARELARRGLLCGQRERGRPPFRNVRSGGLAESGEGQGDSAAGR